MPRLIVQYADREWVHELEESLTHIGRAEENNVRVPDRHVSARHCRIERTGDGYVLYDLGGMNGTIVNGRQISDRRLKPGDEIQIGSATIYFERAPELGDCTLHAILGEDKGETFDLTEQFNTIGRHPSCTIGLRDTSVSSFHAVVERVGHMLILRDLNSTNGTFLNGQQVRDFVRFGVGDRIQVGNCVFSVEKEEREEEGPGLPSEGDMTVQVMPVQPRAQGDTRFVEEEGRQFVLRTMGSRGHGWLLLALGILGVVTVVAVVVLGLMGYIPVKDLFRPASKRAKGPSELLGSAGHFETGKGEAVPKEWEVSSGVWRVDASAARPGSSFPSLVARATPSGISTVVCTRKVQVEKGTSYTLSGWLKSDGGAGICTLGILWSSEADPALEWESFSSPIVGKKDWSKVDFEAEPPVGARQLQVMCMAAGNSGEIQFSDLKLRPKPSSRIDLSLGPLGEKNLLVLMNDSGVLSVRRGDELLAWGGQLVIETKQGGIAVRQSMSEFLEEPKSPGGAKEVSGKLIDPASLNVFFFKESLMPNPYEIRVVYVISTTQKIDLKVLGLRFMVRAKDIEDGIMLCFEMDSQVREGEFTAKDVYEIILGGDEKQMVIKFGVPVAVACKPDGERYVLFPHVTEQVLVPDESGEFQVTFTASSERMRDEARVTLSRAASAATSGQLGSALRTFETIVSNPFFPGPERKAARVELQKAEKEAEKLMSDASSKCDEATASGEEDSLREFEALLVELEGKLAETEYIARIGELRSKVEQSRQQKAAKAEQDVKRLLAKAREFYGKKQWLPAEIFCKNVISRAPESDEAKEATALIGRIEERKKVVEEQEKWVDGKLRQAKTYHRNRFYQKAVEILEEIIRTYPDSRHIGEVKKQLDESKKAFEKE